MGVARICGANSQLANHFNFSGCSFISFLHASQIHSLALQVVCSVRLLWVSGCLLQLACRPRDQGPCPSPSSSSSPTNTCIDIIIYREVTWKIKPSYTIYLFILCALIYVPVLVLIFFLVCPLKSGCDFLLHVVLRPLRPCLTSHQLHMVCCLLCL